MKNPAASVRARLLAYCQQQGLVFNDMLIRYTLARVADSPYSEHFVLKGGMLYPIWGASSAVYRSTRDLDFLGYGTADPARILALFQLAR